MTKVEDLFGKKKRGSAHKVVIVGGGNIGMSIARSLQKENMNVTLIEKDKNVCRKLSEELDNVLIVKGDGTNINLLKEVGIETCDALVYDYLVSAELKGWVKPGCELHYVGKRSGFHSKSQEEIEALLLRLAGEGKSVVRLKGGDPFIFGRGGEEAQTLHRAGILFEVIPAVTAALGCAAYSGLPLTHRDWSSAVTLQLLL